MNASCPVTRQIQLDKLLVKRKFREIERTLKHVNREINIHDRNLCSFPKMQKQNFVHVAGKENKKDLIVAVKNNVNFEADLVEALNHSAYIIVSIRPKKYPVAELLLSVFTLIITPFIF